MCYSCKENKAKDKSDRKKNFYRLKIKFEQIC